MRNEPWLEPFEGHWPELHEDAFAHGSAVLIGQVKVGARASIWPNATLRGDDGRIEIGEDSNIQDGSVVHLTGGLSHTTVGCRVTVGHNVTLHGATVEDDCLVGMGAIVLDNAHVGHHSLIGAGALVTQGTQIPPYSLVLGSPAKVIRPLKEAELRQIDQGWRTYAAHAARYLAMQRQRRP
jgi:carbonic anhydrase/acetyltransferase-like protein (isoleucine patch superfamily)